MINYILFSFTLVLSLSVSSKETQQGKKKKNQVFNLHPELTKYLVNQHLSEANIKKSCEIFSKILDPLKDEYLSKFRIYCLVYSGKEEEAQLIFDLKKELGFEEEYFERKMNFFFGYNTKIDTAI